MKSTWYKILLFAFVCFVPLQMASAGTSLSGSQTAGSPGSGAKLSSNPVTLAQPMTISAVSGSNAGFWIQSGSNTVAKFHQPNDPGVVGTTLPPGTYTVYPNLPNGAKSATVTLSFK